MTQLLQQNRKQTNKRRSNDLFSLSGGVVKEMKRRQQQQQKTKQTKEECGGDCGGTNKTKTKTRNTMNTKLYHNQLSIGSNQQKAESSRQLCTFFHLFQFSSIEIHIAEKTGGRIIH